MKRGPLSKKKFIVTFRKNGLFAFFLKKTAPTKTKFGGQPDWLDLPQWPICRSTRLPMDFVCQVEIPNDLFPKAQGKMAYIFIGCGSYFYEAAGGDNAVIIQPGGIIPTVSTSRLKGSKLASPILSRNYSPGSLPPQSTSPEYIDFESLSTGPSAAPLTSFVLNPGDDPEYDKNSFFEGPKDGINISDYDDDTKFEEDIGEQWEKFYEQLWGTKIGGLPVFIQEEDYPGDKVNRLLLQIDCSEFPAAGLEDGVIHVFINEKGTKGRLMYQR